MHTTKVIANFLFVFIYVTQPFPNVNNNQNEVGTIGQMLQRAQLNANNRPGGYNGAEQAMSNNGQLTPNSQISQNTGQMNNQGTRGTPNASGNSSNANTQQLGLQPNIQGQPVNFTDNSNVLNDFTNFTGINAQDANKMSLDQHKILIEQIQRDILNSGNSRNTNGLLQNQPIQNVSPNTYAPSVANNNRINNNPSQQVAISPNNVNGSDDTVPVSAAGFSLPVQNTTASQSNQNSPIATANKGNAMNIQQAGEMESRNMSNNMMSNINNNGAVSLNENMQNSRQQGSAQGAVSVNPDTNSQIMEMVKAALTNEQTLANIIAANPSLVSMIANQQIAQNNSNLPNRPNEVTAVANNQLADRVPQQRVQKPFVPFLGTNLQIDNNAGANNFNSPIIDFINSQMRDKSQAASLAQGQPIVNPMSNSPPLGQQAKTSPQANSNGNSYAFGSQGNNSKPLVDQNLPVTIIQQSTPFNQMPSSMYNNSVKNALNTADSIFFTQKEVMSSHNQLNNTMAIVGSTNQNINVNTAQQIRYQSQPTVPQGHNLQNNPMNSFPIKNGVTSPQNTYVPPLNNNPNYNPMTADPQKMNLNQIPMNLNNLQNSFNVYPDQPFAPQTPVDNFASQNVYGAQQPALILNQHSIPYLPNQNDFGAQPIMNANQNPYNNSGPPNGFGPRSMNIPNQNANTTISSEFPGPIAMNQYSDISTRDAFPNQPVLNQSFNNLQLNPQGYTHAPSNNQISNQMNFNGSNNWNAANQNVLTNQSTASSPILPPSNTQNSNPMIQNGYNGDAGIKNVPPSNASIIKMNSNPSAESNNEVKILDSDLLNLSDSQIKILAERINRLTLRVSTEPETSSNPNQVDNKQVNSRVPNQKAPSTLNAENGDKGMESLMKAQVATRNKISRQENLSQSPSSTSSNNLFNNQLLTQLTDLLMKKGANLDEITSVNDLQSFLTDRSSSPKPPNVPNVEPSRTNSESGNDIITKLRSNQTIQDELTRMFQEMLAKESESKNIQGSNQNTISKTDNGDSGNSSASQNSDRRNNRIDDKSQSISNFDRANQPNRIQNNSSTGGNSFNDGNGNRANPFSTTAEKTNTKMQNSFRSPNQETVTQNNQSQRINRLKNQNNNENSDSDNFYQDSNNSPNTNNRDPTQSNSQDISSRSQGRPNNNSNLPSANPVRDSPFSLPNNDQSQFDSSQAPNLNSRNTRQNSNIQGPVSQRNQLNNPQNLAYDILTEVLPNPNMDRNNQSNFNRPVQSYNVNPRNNQPPQGYNMNPMNNLQSSTNLYRTGPSEDNFQQNNLIGQAISPNNPNESAQNSPYEPFGNPPVDEFAYKPSNQFGYSGPYSNLPPEVYVGPHGSSQPGPRSFSTSNNPTSNPDGSPIIIAQDRQNSSPELGSSTALPWLNGVDTRRKDVNEEIFGTTVSTGFF